MLRYNSGQWHVVLARMVGVVAAAAVLAGCNSMLPNETSRQAYPWATFEEVQAAYDAIEPGKTDFDGLKSKGFDPNVIPNMTTLSYLDVVKRFSPILEKADLPSGVQACIKAQDKCTGYLASPTSINKQRIGNVGMDLLGFRRETKVTGWRFEAVFIMVDNVVVYKLWSGTPEVEEYGKQITPLGPAQNLGGLFAP